eukprot:364509-Chlamydomonas_euryale.AAC.1
MCGAQVNFPVGSINSAAAFSAATSAWVGAGGGDWYEGQMGALHDLPSAGGWSSGASRVVVWFGGATDMLSLGHVVWRCDQYALAWSCGLRVGPICSRLVVWFGGATDALACVLPQPHVCAAALACAILWRACVACPVCAAAAALACAILWLCAAAAALACAILWRACAACSVCAAAAALACAILWRACAACPVCAAAAALACAILWRACAACPVCAAAAALACATPPCARASALQPARALPPSTLPQLGGLRAV